MSHEPKKRRVVLDTNVLFSAVAFVKENPPLRLLEIVREGKLEAVISPFILEELRKNLIQKMGWDEARYFILEKELKRHFFFIRPQTRLSVIKRVDADNRILECAVDADAHCLISGNMKDLRPLGSFRNIEILTPREFLNKYFP